jgi:hypothetical protein
MKPNTTPKSLELLEGSRTKVVKVRFDEKELEKLRKFAETTGKSLSAYIRESIFDSPPTPTKNTQRWGALGELGNEFLELRDEMMLDRSNDNQLMSYFVAKRLLDTCEKILCEIASLREELL